MAGREIEREREKRQTDDMATTSSANTLYYGLDKYESINGVMTLKAGNPTLPGAAPASTAAATSPSAAGGDDLGTLIAIGMSESKAKETLANGELSSSLLNMVSKAGGAANVTKAMGSMFYDVAVKLRKKKEASALESYVDTIIEYITTGKLVSKPQLDEALKYLKSCRGDLTGLDEAAGVGVVVTAAQIEAGVAAVIGAREAEIKEKRYRFNTGVLQGAIRADATLKWADAKAVKVALDAQIAILLGPRTAADDAPVPKSKKKKEKGSGGGAAGSAGAGAHGKKGKSPAAATEDVGEDFTAVIKRFHGVGKNDETNGYVVTPNTKRLLEEHVRATGGKVHTRFPPEPNGILHIGHAKAINFNFGFARNVDGVCYLRYDDTNPEKEEKAFFDGILEDVQWLGHTPWKVTHSSDYFEQLHEAAVELIKKDLAYVCHQKVDELRGHDAAASPWRNRPVAESLSLFEDMRLGLIDEGKASLRIKHTMEDGKIDPVAYRIKFHPHHRTGDTWCIYPTYVFTHCLCDSFENITHSLCTKEFQNQRSTYYWVCNALDRYCPVQWEYGRLNLTHAVVSKRKIGRLIAAGLVRGWDDPRLFTLPALRRRGFPAAAIHDFTSRVGVTENLVTLEPHMLESCVRDVLNKTATRAMAVLDPLRVVIKSDNSTKTASTATTEVTCPNNPVDESAGSHTVPFSSVIYIDRSDFQEVPEKGFRRLTPDQSVGLKHASLVLNLDEIVKDASGRIIELHCTAVPMTLENKTKGFIQWVSGPSIEIEPRRVQVRYYDRLFRSPKPEQAEGGMLADAKTDTLTIFDAFVDRTVDNAAPGTVFQFERIGFFVVDPDTTEDLMVFNLTVGLRG